MIGLWIAPPPVGARHAVSRLVGALLTAATVVGALLAAPVGRRPTVASGDTVVALRATGAASSAPTTERVASAERAASSASEHSNVNRR